MLNMYRNVEVQVLTVPATKTATVTSSACDVSGFQGALFIITVGVPGDTLSGTVKWDGKLQSCATETGTYSDVATADVESLNASQTNSSSSNHNNN